MKRSAFNMAIAAAHAAAYADSTHSHMPERRSVLALSAGSDGVADLLVYGYIGAWFEGITAEGMVAELASTTARVINIYIASDGGVVSEGLAIYHALRRHPARKVVHIDGVAASIASVIAMGGDEILMPAGSAFMLHGARGPGYGTAEDFEDYAVELRKNNEMMLEAYASRAPKKRAELAAIVNGTKDRWFNAAEAVEFGLADRVIDDVRERSDSAAAASLLSFVQAISVAPEPVSAVLRQHINAAAKPHVFASLTEASQRAVVAHIEDQDMRTRFQQIILANANAGAPAAGAAANTTTPQTAPAAPPAAVAPAPAAPAAPPAAVAPTTPADPITALAARNTQLRAVFATFRHVDGVAALEADCLADPRMTVEAAQQALLARVGQHGQPLNAGGFRVEAGEDERDVQQQRIVQGMLARSGVLSGTAAHEARQGNPAATRSLIQLAEASLQRAGINTRDMDRHQIAQSALAVQTRSDFPVLLEGTLHQMMLLGYRNTPFAWRRFCAIGTLSDYRPHSRYHMSSFSDLALVNEAGEYENGVLGDAEKETIQAKRKGRILSVTPEVLVDDNLGGLRQVSNALGQAAGRTIEKDVFALFALNSGNGPTMSDGNPLFHASHGNIAASGSPPTVESFDAIRQQMGSQQDPGSNDYLDITAALWLGPLSLGAKAREVNGAEYNDESNKNQRRPNVVRGMFTDIIDTPRLPATVWYALANPSVEPVFEVGFLDGVQEPRLEQQTNFKTDGIDWKVVGRYGTAAVGWRGIVKQPGT